MDVKEIERLIKISKEHPLMPETYIPWQQDPKPEEIFLPEVLASLQGLEIYDTLTPAQKLELGRHELVQVIYSYAWGENLFCLFMTRHMLTLQPDNVEHRFLLRELIEEFRHQEMFTQAIARLGGKPLPQTRMHKFVGEFTNKYLPADFLFMGSVSIELVTDVYGNYARKNPQVYTVLRKMFDLHNIEEGRHILFTKSLLKTYSAKASYIKRSLYSYTILINIYFIRTMYVKQEIFERIGLENAEQVYKLAYQNYKKKFAENCLKDIIGFVDEWKGFNKATRWAWRWLLGAEV
jgi:hypothetical protein